VHMQNETEEKEKMAVYDVDSIKILTDEEVNIKFGWVKADSLAAKYQRDRIWVANGLEACRRCGLEPDYFIERHLEGNKAIPKNELIDEAFRDVLKEQQGYGSFTRL
jgi:hypothetical protein